MQLASQDIFVRIKFKLRQAVFGTGDALYGASSFQRPLVSLAMAAWNLCHSPLAVCNLFDRALGSCNSTATVNIISRMHPWAYFWIPASSLCGSLSYWNGFDGVTGLLPKTFVLFLSVTVISFQVARITYPVQHHLRCFSLYIRTSSPGLNIKWVADGNLENIACDMHISATTVAISALASKSADMPFLCLGRDLLITGRDVTSPKTRSHGTSPSIPI